MNGSIALLEPQEIFFVRSEGDDCQVRTRSRKILRSRRRIGSFALPEPPFFRCHQSWIVNLGRVRLVRRRTSADLDLVLDPPVGAVVPVARARVAALWRLLGRP